MNRYLLLIKHAQHCLACTSWLLGGEDSNELCTHGRHLLSHDSFRVGLQPVPVLAGSEPADEFERRTR
jgi:hypothetical protein